MISAIGKEIDMAALASKHEHVRAAGNMNVNARGDVIDGKNEVILDNNRRINSVYNKTVSEGNHAHGMADKFFQHSLDNANMETKKSELTPDEPNHVTHTSIEEPDIITPEEMELLHDDEVAEDDFSVNDIVKVVSQKP
jgi:hypothetical protein